MNSCLEVIRFGLFRTRISSRRKRSFTSVIYAVSDPVLLKRGKVLTFAQENNYLWLY